MLAELLMIGFILGEDDYIRRRQQEEEMERLRRRNRELEHNSQIYWYSSLEPATHCRREEEKDLTKRWEYSPRTDTLQIVTKKKKDIIPGPCRRWGYNYRLRCFYPMPDDCGARSYTPNSIDCIVVEGEEIWPPDDEKWVIGGEYYWYPYFDMEALFEEFGIH